MFLGGQDVDTSASPDYSAFVLRRDGQAAVLRRRAGQTTPLAAWQRHDAILPGKAEGDPVKNVIKVDVDPQNVTLWVNAAKVLAVPRADIRADGRVGFRVGKDMNLHITTLNVTRKFAPGSCQEGVGASVASTKSGARSPACVCHAPGDIDASSRKSRVMCAWS